LLHEAYSLPGLTRRRFTHPELWTLLGTLVDEAGELEREEIGRSAEGRPLYAVRFGRGPARVLLFSQMHGDEPSHTMGIADLLSYFAREPDDERVRRVAEGVTAVFVPMLNPDGAERFVRTNAQGVDVNRDARAFATPELRALRGVVERFRPEWVLNLHDEDVRKRVGKTDRLVALALLSNPATPDLEDDEGRVRGKRLCGAILRAAGPLVEGHAARFPDAYHPAGSGEYTRHQGASTVLVECGFWPDDPEKQYLRKVSFAALLGALEAIADGSWADEPADALDRLEEADSDVMDLVIRGGTVVVPGVEPFRADVGADFDTPLELEGGKTAAVGDLADYAARANVDARGLFVHPAPEALDDGALREGRPASFTVRRGAEPESEAVAEVRDGVLRGEDGC
jgi:hypothetical protein